MLDAVKDIGFKYATLFGATIGMDDISRPRRRRRTSSTEANRKVDEIENQYRNGHITNEERYNRVIDVWTHDERADHRRS